MSIFVLANIFQPLIDVADAILVWIHDNLGFSWGWSIVALTVLVRAALLPLTFKQFKSMQALQRLSPQIKELQKKYKNDKQRMNQEMMKFYQENKVNPLGSCLPLLLQLPVFLALFYTLQGSLRMNICGQDADPCGQVVPGSAEFLFIPDLTDKAGGWVLIVLIAAYVGSQLLASLLMTVTADKTQRRLMMALPLVFIVFIINFPAGLIVYWITTNLWTILQQYIIRKTVGPLQPAPAAAEGGGIMALLKGGDDDKDKAPAPAGNNRGAKKAAEPAKAAAKSGKGSGGGGAKPAKPSGPPPRAPRKRKRKRTGRRR